MASASEKNVFVAPRIPEKKLNAAIKAFDFSGNPDSVIAIYDNTLLGSGKDGLLFTGERVIYRPTFSDPIEIVFTDITGARYTETPSGKNNDKVIQGIEVSLKKGGSVSIKDMLNCDYQKLAMLLQSCASDFDEHKEERQLIPVEEMSDALKVAYVKTIINMAFADDGTVDDKEFAEILLLMTRLNLSPDSRFELRAYLSSDESLVPVESLLATINDECPEGQVRLVHISLAKDLINTHLSTGGTSLADFRFFTDNRHLFDVTDGELELITMAIETDHKMLKSEYSDDHLMAAMKSMSAKAAAVGTPLAAVYLTGSVVGLSAAGMTSGLATLGMGGLLGLSSMATGIGVVVLIGVGAYTGVRKLTGADETTKSRRRELMLNEVIKQTQSTISLLVEDINFVVGKLNTVMATTDRHEAQIRKLVGLMQQMTSAGGILVGKTNSAQNNVTRIRCARVLNVARLHSLTREPTRIPLYDFILGFYEERMEVSEKDGSEAKAMVLRQDCDTGELERLAKAFEAVGYFDAGEVAKGATVDVALKAKNKLVGLFS
ncbi:MAG: hypothetical protein AB7E55_27700 [Pigmentiphaga sp.]